MILSKDLIVFLNMDQIKVISLNTVKDVNEAEIDSKAASLVRLKQAGFSVPSGFCINATAF